MLSPFDALSVATCTAQFLDFSIKVLSKGNELYSSTFGSLEENRIIVETAQRLLEHKERLKACLGIQSQAVPQSPGSIQATNSPQTQEISQITSIRQLCQKCFETSDTLIVRLHRLEVPLGAKHRKWKSLRQALKSQWNKAELDEFHDRLWSYKQELGLYILLNNDIPEDTIAELRNMMSRLVDHSKDVLDNSEEILGSQNCLESTVQSGFIDELKSEIDRIAEISKTIEIRMDKAERERLLNWLSSVNPSSNYNNARQQHEPHTSDWLIHDERVQSWYTNRSSFLWLHGKAGSGKTILSSSVINHIKSAIVSPSRPDISLAYFYFNFSDERKQAVEEMICSMIKQLSCFGHGNSPELEVLKKHQEKGHRPNLTTLEAVLLSIIRQHSAVYLVVDALDECPFGNGQRKTLMDSLSRIYLAAPDSLKMLCTSRNEPDIEAYLKAWFSSARRGIAIDLMASKAQVDNDIAIYIKNRLDSNEYSSWPENFKHEAEVALMERADGMFQYVACQLNILQRLSSRGKVRTALKNLPKGLDATYDRILLNVDINFQKQVARTLSWLAFSLSPLSLEQLAEIFILDPIAKVPFDEEEKIFDPRDILKYIPGLVTIYDTRWRKPKLRVRLSHSSIKEYLKSDRIRQGPAKDFALSETFAHLEIIHSCLAYTICRSNQVYDLIGSDAQIKSSFPLWDYIENDFTRHLDKIDSVYWNDHIHECLAQVFAVGSLGLILLCFSASLSIPNRVYVEELRKDVGLPLYYASIVGSLPLIKWLIGRGANINQHSVVTYTTPLQAIIASDIAGGSRSLNLPTAVELLLNKGADINATSKVWGCALHLAIKYARVDILEMLLVKGADANLVVDGQHALSKFAEFKSDKSVAIEIIRLLLEYGADVNARCRLYGNALKTAVACFNFETAKVLLSYGAKLDSSGAEWEELLSETRNEEASELPELHQDPNVYLERKFQENKDTRERYKRKIRGKENRKGGRSQNGRS